MKIFNVYLKVKCDAIRGYGAELVFCAPSPTARKDTCARIAAETGSAIVHPYDDYAVMAGQATIAVELHEQVSKNITLLYLEIFYDYFHR